MKVINELNESLERLTHILKSFKASIEEFEFVINLLETKNNRLKPFETKYKYHK